MLEPAIIFAQYGIPFINPNEESSIIFGPITDLIFYESKTTTNS